ncbi:hypothetical protein KBI52_19960, partial [Microvirga sp. HBU67558]
ASAPSWNHSGLGHSTLFGTGSKSRLPIDAFEALKSVRFEYEKKITLAMALGLPSDFKGALKRLGEIRNAFAHNLDATLAEHNVGFLFRVFDAEMKSIMHQSYSRAYKKMPNSERPRDIGKLEARDKFSLYVVQLWSALYSINLSEEGDEGQGSATGV